MCGRRDAYRLSPSGLEAMKKEAGQTTTADVIAKIGEAATVAGVVSEAVKNQPVNEL